MLGAHVYTVASQVTLAQHFLRDEGFVGQCVVALEGIAGERRQAPVINLQPMFVGQQLPAFTDVQTSFGDGVPGLRTS